MRTGILITNLGSPDAPTKEALRTYLKEFLWDKRVVDVFRPLWWLILNGIILNTRPKKSAHAYQAVWTEQGSPLIAISKAQRNALQQQFWQNPIALGMRYGNPSIEKALLQLRDQGCGRVIVFPLYPQFSYTTTGSTQDAIKNFQRKYPGLFEFEWALSYPDQSDYVQALVNSIKEHWAQHGQAEVLLFSYHGLPQRYVRNGDPYFHECARTTRAVVDALGLKKPHWKMAFQSRFGKEPWLKPYTDEVLENFAKSGVKSVQVICPAFSADCLETLEEIDIQYREVFLNSGGEEFSYIPALNDRKDHVTALGNIVRQSLTHMMKNVSAAEWGHVFPIAEMGEET